MLEKNNDVTATLQGSEVHDGWTSGYRTPENEAFYDMAFDYLATVYGTPGDAEVLDAGCGSSTKSIHLAKRGYRVMAVDVSRSILDIARKAVADKGLQDRVTHQWADLTAMPFADGAFSRVLCWGVLMHVPNVEGAVSELARVTRSGGTIIISEGNVRSAQAVGLRGLKRLLGKQRAEVRDTPAGIEFWEETGDGRLVTRQANIAWLIRAFEQRGAKLIERRAGQFSELFTLFKSKPMRRVIHAFNTFWFKGVRAPGPAFGNLLVFRKA